MINILIEHQMIVYLVAVCLGALFGLFTIKRIGDNKNIISSGFTKGYTHEQKQALVFAIVVTCLATAIGSSSSYIVNVQLRFILSVLLLFLIGIAFVLFSVVGYSLYVR